MVTPGVCPLRMDSCGCIRYRPSEALPALIGMGQPKSVHGAVDPVLLDALRKGDNDAYRQVLSTMGPPLLTLARRFMRTEADAQDVLQEGMVLAFRKMHTFTGEGSLEGWLRRIVINCALGKLRHHKAKNEASIDDLMPEFDDRGCRIEPHAPDLPSPETVLADERSRRVVRNAIDQLPDNHRTILLLRDIEGMSTQEAADVLGIEAGTAKVRLHRARSALKKLLEPLRAEGGLE